MPHDRHNRTSGQSPLVCPVSGLRSGTRCLPDPARAEQLLPVPRLHVHRAIPAIEGGIDSRPFRAGRRHYLSVHGSSSILVRTSAGSDTVKYAIQGRIQCSSKAAEGTKIVRQLLRFASLGHRVSTRALAWVKTHSAETTSSGTCFVVGHVFLLHCK